MPTTAAFSTDSSLIVRAQARDPEAWQRLVRRRNKAVRLVEELDLRTQRLQPLLDKLGEIARRGLLEVSG